MRDSPGRLAPPSGHPPPVEAKLPDGTRLDLLALSTQICARYRGEFPDEEGRYGDAGIAWCVHDNQHLLNWAALSLSEIVDFDRELSWLAGVLAARDFPLDRLRRDLEIAADVTEGLLGEAGAGLAAKLRAGCQAVP